MLLAPPLSTRLPPTHSRRSQGVHELATIDRQHGAGGKGACVGRQQEEGRIEFLGVAQAPLRDALDERFARIRFVTGNAATSPVRAGCVILGRSAAGLQRRGASTDVA